MAAGIPARLTAREGRKFAFTVGIAFLVFAGIAVWRHKRLPSEIFGGLGLVLVLLGTFIPTRLGPVQRAWMGLAHAISKVTTPIIMSAIYFLVVTPIGLVGRLFGWRPLVHKEEDGGFWKAPPSGGRSDMTHQF